MTHLFEPDRLVLGTWAQVASAEIVDMIGLSGFDFAIVDAEHGYFGLETAENMFRACDAVRITPTIRLPANDPVMITKAFDAGATAVVIPGVGSQEDAETAVGASRFAPRGNRGACPCVRAGGHFIRDWQSYVRRVESETGVVLLVETQAGLDDFDNIVRVPDVMGFLIGPFDLSVSLGYEGDYRRPEVQDAVDYMVRRAQEQGVPVMMPVFDANPVEARHQLSDWYERGVRCFVVGTDKIIISAAMTQYADNLRITAN